MALKFEYDKENRVAKVCGVDNEACTEIVIPATVEYYKKEYKVTSIGQSAFWGCKSLTSVTIPNSVTAIGGGAFCNCVRLKEFKGKYAADGGRCLIKDSTLIAYAVASGTTYAIPDGVTEIGESAFGDCKSLTRVTIPNSVTEIGESAFRDCSSLTSVTIPDSVTAIRFWAFRSCTSLTSVTIPDSVTSIESSVFNNCVRLKEFKGKYAADGGRCLIKDSTLIAYANASGTIYAIPDGVTEIGKSAFWGCESLTSVTIPNSVTSIGFGAFMGCESLANVTIPSSVIKIGKVAFKDCKSLKEVRICNDEGCVEIDKAFSSTAVIHYVGKDWIDQAEKAKAATPAATSVDVILANAGNVKLPVIKAVKDLLGISLGDAIALVNTAPNVLKRGVSNAEAASFVRALEDAGADIVVKASSLGEW